ncbi:complement C1q-like protein 4 [Saccostrea cucullata]|uniref:complement C1q-like protein 4 n=1 Tax=Saccostrea cuccullata TaxID=36930 RepID=UPI002ED361D5
MSILAILFVVGLLHGERGFSLNVTNHENDIGHLKQLIQQLNVSLQHTVNNEIDQLKRETSLLKTKINAQSQNPIAFTARLSHDVELLGEQTIVFDKIILNLGNAYHESYGHFTAPVQGVYQFAVSLLNDGKESYFSLMRNGNQVLSMLYIRSGTFYSSSSIVVAQLEANDVVFVKGTRTANLDESYYCIFSGFLIQ